LGGADPRLATAQNVTPLMAAAGLGFWDGEPRRRAGSPRAVKLTIEARQRHQRRRRPTFGGPPLEAGDMNLHCPPAESGRFSRGHALGQHRAPRTALRGANSIVNFLVEKGATLDVRNSAGFTPLVVAEGVFVANTVKTWDSTAALIRQLMETQQANRR
jgi:hypothetical protein